MFMGMIIAIYQFYCVQASSHLKCAKTVPLLEIDYISIFCRNILL